MERGHNFYFCRSNGDGKIGNDAYEKRLRLDYGVQQNNSKLKLKNK